ncbi:MAG: hypothetical protein ABI905_13805 [Betaproteobacteria bacterium]
MNLDVLIPSLLLPAHLQSLIQPPVVPALERLLARADRRAGVALDAATWLGERWGVSVPYPIAALVAAHDGLQTGEGGWMFAEPVHMAADRDAVKLFPGRLELTGQESQEMITSLNAHFSTDGLEFFSPVPGRWYVRCDRDEIPATVSPEVARLAPLSENQPKSHGKLNWRALQNEAQMLLFSHPVNAAREAAGKNTVNGVWFWGGGVAPQIARTVPTGYDLVLTDTPLASQLAVASGIPLLPALFASLKSAKGNVLVVLDRCEQAMGERDLDEWSRELGELDRQWFQPIAAALATGTISRLNIHTPGAAKPMSFHLTRTQQWLKFWRSTPSLGSYA